MRWLIAVVVGAVATMLAVFGLRKQSSSLADTALDLAERNKRKAKTDAKANKVAAEEKANAAVNAVHGEVEEEIAKATSGDDHASNLVDFVNASMGRRKTDRSNPDTDREDNTGS